MAPTGGTGHYFVYTQRSGHGASLHKSPHRSNDLKIFIHHSVTEDDIYINMQTNTI